MLPGSTGALYVYNNSRDHLVPAATWGTEGAAMAAPFEPHECWSLRRGKATLGRKGLSHVACAHVDTDELCYLCIPIMARGKVLGVLHLRAPGDEPAEAFAGGMREIAESLAEQLSLALVNIELKESLKNMAIRDALTGLYNRRFLDEVLARELARADRLRSPLSVIMIDIDHFKKFNDTYGHAAGDEVLKQVCAYLSDSLRQTEIVCRYGGEELVILLPDCDAGGAVEIAEKLRNGIRSLAVVHHGQDLPRVTASLGVTAYPEVTTSKADVVAAADQALYEAKRNGRDQTRLHTTQPAPAE
jgi:diguanylate cyclase (GGDEF)-like protein